MGSDDGTVRGGLPAHHNGSTTLAIILLRKERAANGHDGQQKEGAFHRERENNYSQISVAEVQSTTFTVV
jgi:hypothetical protein